MQIPLIDLPNPLELTIGREFFKQIPKSPGVYRMYSDDDALLYVGKAKNLRSRLMTYRRVKLGRASSKSLRLVHQVSRIEWQECASEEQALLEENALLRAHKPPFNVVNTQPEKYFYFIVNILEDIESGVRARIQMSLNGVPEGAVFGAYKGLALCHRTFWALRRLLWVLRQTPGFGRFEYPLELYRRQKLVPHEFEISSADLNRLAGFLHGFTGSPVETEPELLVRAQAHFSQFQSDEFHRNWFLDDLQTLSQFFRVGPRRNHSLKHYLQLDSPVIPQGHVDDLLVQRRFRTTA